MTELFLGFLASHSGTNMQAIINACKSGLINAVPSAVISNNSASYALERARHEGIPAYHISSATHPDQFQYDTAILDAFAENNVNLIILAGFMKKLSGKIIQAYKGRVLNIHPALLPKFGGEGMWGKKVHEAVIKNKENVTGPTIHVVDEFYDHGRILAQTEVPVYPHDTPDTLAERMLVQEHKLFPKVIGMIANGEIIL